MSILTPIAVGIRFRFSCRSAAIFLFITHCYYGIIWNFGMPIPGEYEDITRHIGPMDIFVKGKNLDVGDALSSHVGAQLDGAQDRGTKQLRPYTRKLVNHHAKNRTVDNVLPKRQYWLDRSGQHVAVAENDRIT